MPPSRYGTIYESLLTRCPPLGGLKPPWDFVLIPDTFHGPVYDENETVAALREKFPDLSLLRSGVLRQDASGKFHLVPPLLNPVGGVVALRDHPERRPLALLTGRGTLNRNSHPIFLALRDSWTVERVVRGGVLFGVFHLREMALFNALDLPAVLCLGLSHLPLDRLRALDEAFSFREFVPGVAQVESSPERKRYVYQEGEPAPEVYHPALVSKPILALLGWSPLALRTSGSSLLHGAAAYLRAARKHLGLQFRGVMIWRPTDEELQNLRFRVSLRDTELVREILHDSSDRLLDFENFADPELPSPPEPNNFVEAREEVLKQLATDRRQLSPRALAAMQKHRELLDRDVIGPLRDWMQTKEDPVFKSAGDELASLAAMLHEMSPLVHELLRRQSVMALEGGAEPRLSATLMQYMQLLGRHGALLRDMRRWSKWL